MAPEALRTPLAGLRQHVADESVDLVYPDPAFNSEQDYNALFAEHGVKAAAQIKAFLTVYLEFRWYVNGERATFADRATTP